MVILCYVDKNINEHDVYGIGEDHSFENSLVNNIRVNEQ